VNNKAPSFHASIVSRRNYLRSDEISLNEVLPDGYDEVALEKKPASPSSPMKSGQVATVKTRPLEFDLVFCGEDF